MASLCTFNSQKPNSRTPIKHNCEMSKVYVHFDFTQIVPLWHNMFTGFQQRQRLRSVVWNWTNDVRKIMSGPNFISNTNYTKICN